MKFASKRKRLEAGKETGGDVKEGEQRKCPTLLLEDTPAEDDQLAFGGETGPHERVAQAIAEVILSPHESGGKMIGLEGGWGAGKTTVINLLRKHLAANPNITVVSFDAWAHEGDPLRRTFLETLIRHFQSITGWLTETENEEWSKKLLQLAKRQRQTETTTVPKIKTFGAIFAIAAFLVPIGLVFLQTSLSQGIAINPSLPISWEFVIGCILTVAPLLLLIGKLILVRRKKDIKKKSSNESTDKSKSEEQDVDDLAILQGKVITTTTEDITETPEPTSIEFEDTFCELMKTVLPADSSRRAIIVLDNLDRIDPKDALSIWATLQTFLQDRDTKMEQWFSKLWIIVPYDPSGLRHLWASRRVVDDDTEKKYTDEKDTGKKDTEKKDTEKKDTEKKDTEKKNIELTIGRTSAEQTVTVSFIDKSFQLRFEVPPPVLSNWKTYLIKLVEKALPKHSADQDMIYRVFDMCRAKGSSPPTPRELKLYVNQIGVIHRQWQHNFPIDHIAYYVILRRRNVNVFRGLIEGILPEKNIAQILSPDLRDRDNLRDNLAGLAFNVRTQLGRQLILDDPIYDALARNDFAELQNLEKVNKDGFWAVLVAISPRLAGADAITIANIASCLVQSDILKQHERNESALIKRDLGGAASRIDNWAPFDESLAGGIASACHLAAELEVSKKVTNSLRQSISKLAKLEETPIVTEGVVKGMVIFFKKIDELGHLDALDGPFTLPINAQGWVEICPLIKTQESRFFKFFQPNTTCDEISKILCAVVTQGQISGKTLAALQVTQLSALDCNWLSLAEAIEQRLQANNNVKSEEANFLLQGLSLLRSYNCDAANAATKRLAESGHLLHDLHQAQSQNHAECKARLIATYLEQVPDATMSQNIGNATAGHGDLIGSLSADDHELAAKVLDVLCEQNNQELLFTIADARGQYDPIILRCLRIIADSESSENIFKPEIIISRWPNLQKYLNEDVSPDRFDRLIKHLCDKSPLVQRVQEDVAGFDYKHVGLYLAIYKASSLPSFGEWCRNGLITFDTDTWKAELDHEGSGLKLMLDLIEASINVVLKQPYQDALVEHAKGVLSGSVTPSKPLVSQWPKVLDGLGVGGAQKVLGRDLRDAAMDRSGKCADVFFDMYGEAIADKAILREENGIVRKLFTPLVKERSIGGLRWLRGVFSKQTDLLYKYTDSDSVEDFRERLQSEFGKTGDKDDEAHNLIVDIANTLGIKPTEDRAKNGDTTPTEVSEAEDDQKANSKETT